MNSCVARCALRVTFVLTLGLLLVGCGTRATPVAAPPATSEQAPVAATATTAPPTPTPLVNVGATTQLTGTALVEALRGGGYIIFLRHTTTDMSVGDTDTPELADCSKQRNLNAQGREEASQIGKAMRDLDIPISQVLTSRYCRTMDTAMLAFGRQMVPTPTDDITGFNLAPDSAERRRRNEALRALLSTPPPTGQNLVLVSHQFNLGDVTGLESKEGDALLFAPTGPAGFTLVGRVAASEWPALTR